MASKLARSGDGRVEELSAPPTFPRSQTGFLIISYYGLPWRLQRAPEEEQMGRFVISPAFPAPRMGGRGKGLLRGGRPRVRIPQRLRKPCDARQGRRLHQL